MPFVTPQTPKESIVYEQRLQCTSGNNNKFYNVYVYIDNDAAMPYRVITHHGRIGNNGSQRSPAAYFALPDATERARNIIADKLRRGYVIISNPAYSTLQKPDKEEKEFNRFATLEL